MKIYLTSAQTGVTAPLSADLYVINKYYPTLKLPTLYPGRLCRPMLQEILEILNTQHFPAHGLHLPHIQTSRTILSGAAPSSAGIWLLGKSCTVYTCVTM